MERNRKFKRKKEALALQTEVTAVRDSIRKQGWVELDKPIRYGWNAEYVVREDIARSLYGPLYQQLINVVGHMVWSRRKDFKYKISKKTWDIKIPYFKKLTEEEFERLPDNIKHFYRISYDVKRRRYMYRCIVELWKFTVKVTTNYKTHYREHDEILYQKEAELQDKLYGEYRKESRRNFSSSCKSFYGNQFNRSDRRRDSKSLRDIKVAYNVPFLVYELALEGNPQDIVFQSSKNGVRWYCY